MFSALRRRLHVSPPTVIATLALVFAMTGGAYAAKKYLITSTKQISPKVLKALSGKAGSTGANGANGTAGPAGPQGAAGATGAKGETGAAGAPGKEGVPGKEGKEGSPWTAGGTLPSGKSETGAWSVEAHGEGVALGSLSFTIRLEKPLDSEHVVFLEPEQENAHCPGTPGNPKAGVGYLCVYTQRIFGGLTSSAFAAVKEPSVEIGAGLGAGISGAIVVLSPAEPPEPIAGAYGTWAVTAP